MTENVSSLHVRNPHRNGYDFELLTEYIPELRDRLVRRSDGGTTIDFSKQRDVFLLNRALLFAHYKIRYWKLPDAYLCPGVPGRVDYLLYLSQLAGKSVPKGENIRLLDIGTGASCIYPLLANRLFGWSSAASDIDKIAINFALENVDKNDLSSKIKVLKQSDSNSYFNGIISEGERFDFTICNPPFFKNRKDAEAANIRKNKNLKGSKKSSLNFGGKSHELWVKGGELAFIKSMILESRSYQKQVYWFSSLVSDRRNLKSLTRTLQQTTADYQLIEMQHGLKKIHALAWTFLDEKLQKLWSEARWSR